MTPEPSLSGNVKVWNTTQEILQQPAVWRSCTAEMAKRSDEVKDWVQRRHPDEIWFCGAGTSAFIGETLAAYLNGFPGPVRFRSIPTTDFVANPRAFIRVPVRVLVVSFGRSGNSSETVAMLDVLERHAPQYDRLNITCNGDSRLSSPGNSGPGELKTIILPPQTNDRGFAMTSSYTTMLLTALACFDPAPPAAVEPLLHSLADAADGVLTSGFAALSQLTVPERAVFLGSGPLTGAARECALKVLELAAGHITTSWDSTLGFRHGPKAVVNGRTRVFVLESADPHTRQYDRDLAQEIGEQFGKATPVSIGSAGDADIHVPSIGNDAWSAVLYVLIGQILSVFWSQDLGLTVDDPFAGRNLTRVVSGVTIYDLPSRPREAVGAMDIGGTKIETTLFDAELNPLDRNRIDTPTGSYAALIDAIAAQADWLEAKAGARVSVGIGFPGLINAANGVATTANLPATGHTIRADLEQRLQRRVPVENDCKCFALSEANGGAGEAFRTVFGLILGTGVGGGVCVDGRLQTALNGLPGEVGHFGIPAALIAKHKLPVLSCGCGRAGCYETLVSGPGMSRIAEHVTGKPASPAEIAAAGSGSELAPVFAIWLELLGELIHTLQLTIDPDCIVLGGGLSRIDGLAERLAQSFEQQKLPGVRSPSFRIARFGDASGVRGAAILARGVN